MKLLPLLPALLALPLLAADPDPAESADIPALESAAPASAWRVSGGVRAAPGVKTSATVDVRAAVRMVGALPRPSVRAAKAASSVSTSTTTEDLGTEFSGTTEDDAQAQSGWTGATRYEFDNGYIDMDDGTPREDDTTNWHFDSADAFRDGVLRGERAYSGTTTSRTRTTETETRTSSSGGSSSVSFHEDWADGLGDSSDETALGVELRLERTLWEGERFGLDFGIGYVWYDDIDAFSIRGRAYSATATARASSSATTETTVRTTVSETGVIESGTVVTLVRQDDFTGIEDIQNEDGTIGGAYVANGTLQDGYQTPPLAVSEDLFSTSVKRNPTETETSSNTSTSSGKPGTKTATSSRSARRTVDVRSEGTLALQELRVGLRPSWKATDWLTVRTDFGLLAIYSELETETRIFVDGAQVAAIRKDDDDWTVGGFAGLALAAAVTERLEISLGAEARFPHRTLHFNDGIVSGGVDLAEWSATAAVCFRF